MRTRLGIGLSSSLTLIVLGLGGTALAEEPAPHWTYQGAEGPTHWGRLGLGYQECKLGHRQSPIDIRVVQMAALPPIEFSYQTSPLHIIDNGHTIQVNVQPGSFITVGGKRYDLMQFHFHRPSENALDGTVFAMEGHLVHKDAEGKLAVVAVLLTKGKASPFIDGLWKHLPADRGKESAPEGVTVDPGGLLPADHAYYTFTGSLTTPPCSEGVTWFLLRTAGQISKAEDALFSRRYAHNARPLQPLDGRDVQMTQ